MYICMCVFMRLYIHSKILRLKYTAEKSVRIRSSSGPHFPAF